MKDTIFSDKDFKNIWLDSNQKSIRSFAFNDKVAAVFDDMVHRSIPGYAVAQHITAKIAHAVTKNSSHIYDLGCSTGTSLIKIAQFLSPKILDESDIKLIGVDISGDMLKRAKEKIDAFNLTRHITLLEEDLKQVALENASLIVSHYTLQFIKPEDRLPILEKMYASLLPGSCFIFSEKVKHEPPLLDDLLNHEYYEFKKGNGYSEVENIRKRQALENVLVPLTLDENISLLARAQFRNIEILHKELCFTTLIGWK
jgi:tRNA (cmo5U34)-methyltransferase